MNNYSTVFTTWNSFHFNSHMFNATLVQVFKSPFFLKIVTTVYRT
jgi:hypothetical protein